MFSFNRRGGTRYDSATQAAAMYDAALRDAMPAVVPIVARNEQRHPGDIIDPKRLTPRPVAQDTGSDRRLQQAIFDPAKYGDMQIIPTVLPALGEAVVLSRPSNTRIYLFIQNNTAGVVTFAFDQTVNLGSGITLAAGQSFVFDAAVPQNELHVFAAAGGSVIVAFINSDIANKTS